MQPGQRVSSRRFIDMGIDLQGRADPAMPEDGLSIAWRDLENLEQCCDHVPDPVHRDQRNAVLLADAREGSHEIARFDRPAGAGRKYQPGVSPCGAELDSVGPLGLPAERSALHRRARSAVGLLSGPRLDRADVQSPAARWTCWRIRMT
jgi:hypothetical protein